MSLSRYVESLTPHRFWALTFAVCWIAVVLVAGGPAVLAERALDRHVALAIVVMVLGSAALAVVLAELLRGLLFPGGGWTGRAHFIIIGLLWMVLAAFSMLVLGSMSGG